jgi:hypothetical protein
MFPYFRSARQVLRSWFATAKRQPIRKRETRARLRVEALEARTTPSATIVTDQPTYVGGQTAVILGNGFMPDESVTLQVAHSASLDPVSGLGSWTINTDQNGAFQTSWFLSPVESLGTSFTLAAMGSSDDMMDMASTTFSDQGLRSTDRPYSSRPIDFVKGQDL